MIRRRPFSSLLLVLALSVAALAWHNRVHVQAFPGIVGAYSAKEYCSCRYVSHNPADYCAAYVEQYVPLAGFFDDAANKWVVARALGSTQTAQWLGPRQGCQLLPESAPLPAP
ncbi:MAG TPA: amidase [Pseudomonas sp.]|nr:amidase [Pseudomonas sp.]